MGLGRAFSYMTKDKDWFIRLLGGVWFWLLFFVVFILLAVIVFLPAAISVATSPNNIPSPASIALLIGGGLFGILVFLVLAFLFSSIFYGYLVRLVANIAEGKEVPLPRWFQGFGSTIKWGFLASIIVFIWSIQGSILSGIASSASTYTASSSGTMVQHATATSTTFSILAGLWQLFVLLILPVFFTRYAVTKRFGAAFQLGEIFRIFGNNLGTYAIVFLLEIVVWIIAAAGLIAIGIGVLFTAMYAVFVVAGLWGFAYREVMTKMGQPLPAGGPVPPYEPYRPTEPTPPSQPTAPSEPLPPSDTIPPSGTLPPSEPPSEPLSPAEPLPPGEPQTPSDTTPPSDTNPPSGSVPPDENRPTV